MDRFNLLKGARQAIAPTATAFAFVGFTTTILLAVEERFDLDAVIFIYFFPTTLLAIQYGSATAMIAIITSDLAAAYFLYSPKFSMKVSDPLDVFEILLFTILAVMATKVVSGFANDPKVRERKKRPLIIYSRRTK